MAEPEPDPDAFERQAALTAAALDCAGEGILVVDPAGRTLLVNNAARRFMGSDVVDGRPDVWASTYGLLRMDGTTPLAPEEVPLYRAMRGETVVDQLMISRLPGRADVVLSATARPLAAAGLPPGAMVHFRDVTDRISAEDDARAAQEQLVALNRRLQERVRERTGELEAFSYSVSHDLRAPLRAMNGFTRILLDEYADELPAPALDYLAKVRDNADRLGQLVDALLELSRTQRQELRRRWVDMAALAGLVGAEVSAWERPRVIDLVVDDLPDCHGDPILLRQAWSHLLGNAVKYTRTVDRPRVEVTGQVTDAEVEYRVSDNGVGFDGRYADKMFKAFQRLHPPDEFEGTGIGLALTDVIAGRHGGRVWATSTPGGGATFHFTVRRSAD